MFTFLRIQDVKIMLSYDIHLSDIFKVAYVKAQSLLGITILQKHF